MSEVLVRFGASVEFFRFAALVGFVQMLTDAQRTKDIIELAELRASSALPLTTTSAGRCKASAG